MLKLRLGSRGSKLALVQAQLFQQALLQQRSLAKLEIQIIPITTHGDTWQEPFQIGKDAPPIEPGVFVRALELALSEERIDIAVHSLKDLPSQLDGQFILGGYLPRHDPRDVLCASDLVTLPALHQAIKKGDAEATFRIATCSPRRAAFILNRLPSATILPMRGNVETRLQKLKEQKLHATILAQAGLSRLHLSQPEWIVLGLEEMLPAAGQGVVVAECLRRNSLAGELLTNIADPPTESSALAERSFMATLNAGCQNAVAVHAESQRGELKIQGAVLSLDGKTKLLQEIRGSAQEAPRLGEALARNLLKLGADKILGLR